MIEEKKKSNKGLVIIIVVLVIALLGLVGYICYDKGIIFSKSEVKEESNDKEETTDKEDKGAIEDGELKDDLRRKVTMLLTANYGRLKNDIDKMTASDYNVTSSFVSDIFDGELNENTKLNIILNSTELEPFTFDVSKIDIKEYDSIYYSKVIQNQLSDLSKVKERYKSLFNENVIFKTTTDSCPMYSYDSTNNIYFVTYECGGIEMRSKMLYNNKYTYNGNFAYVYVSAGMISPNDDLTASVIYKDIKEDSTIYQENVTSSFEINETNYQDFAEYIITFKKDDSGNYYYYNAVKNK